LEANQRCPEITIPKNVQRAAFSVTLDYEGSTGTFAIYSPENRVFHRVNVSDRLAVD
jgi:hypothetical protein